MTLYVKALSLVISAEIEIAYHRRCLSLPFLTIGVWNQVFII